MNLLIVHTSDLHLNDKSNSIEGRLDKIIAAVRAEASPADAAFLAVTGDIAHSGKPAEYEVAHRFFNGLKTSLESLFSPPVQFIFVPGNHDCNLDHNSQARKRFIADGQAVLQDIERDKHDTSIVDACLAVQDGFFEFLHSMKSVETTLKGHQRLHYRREFHVGGKFIRLECYNTAWLSDLKEKQGQLFYPVNLLDEDDASPDLVVSLFHHPYNWLESTNARAFRKYIERTSDIILTGHEHDPDAYDKPSITGDKPHYAEGAVLQADDSQKSGFNILVVDFTEKLWKITQYEWDKNRHIYTSFRQKPEWCAFERGKHLRRQEFENTKGFVDFLSDAGVVFTHPKATIVKLNDIFVYPDVDRRHAQNEIGQVVSGNRLLEYVIENPYLLVIGPDRSGKSSLCKALYKDLQRREIIPILINGNEVKNTRRNEFANVVHRSFDDQYEEGTFDRYTQLDLKSKVLIIDDFHKAKLSNEGRQLFIECAKRSFGRIILLVDDIFELQGFPLNALLSFQRCVIRQFGHARRAEMIERWYSLGEHFSGDEEAIRLKVEQAERTIDTLLGRHLLPAYPIFILSILQSIETQTGQNTALGSYGYIYEALITAALSRSSSSITLETKYTYISELAYSLFCSNRTGLTEDEVWSLCDHYFEKYKIRIDKTKILQDLEKASVLIQKNGEYTFKYRYLYYYFIAHYMQENLKSIQEGPRLREQISTLTKQVHDDDAANILIFLIYLTKDPEVIATMLQNARRVFAEYEPCDMDRDVRFINESFLEEVNPSYHEADSKTVRQDLLRTVDEIETEIEALEEQQEEQELQQPSENQPSQMAEIDIAFKTVQILGQVLRNFPGSLKGDVKLEIARESYQLGLRTLQLILKQLYSNRENIRNSIKEFLTKQGISHEDELEKKERQFYFLMSLLASGVIIRMISYSVGSDQLRETYREVLNEQQKPAFALVDLAIKLDHIRPIPQWEIFELAERMSGNTLAQTTLRLLVIEYLSLHRTDYKIRQRICSKLKIPVKPVALGSGEGMKL